MVGELEVTTQPDPSALADIDQAQLGGAGLWLRAEPDEDAQQADTLAQIILSDVKSGMEAAS